MSILHSVKRRKKEESRMKETKQTFVRTISPTEKKWVKKEKDRLPGTPTRRKRFKSGFSWLLPESTDGRLLSENLKTRFTSRHFVKPEAVEIFQYSYFFLNSYHHSYHQTIHTCSLKVIRHKVSKAMSCGLTKECTSVKFKIE